MKKFGVLVVVMSLLSAGFAQEKVLHIHKKNYNKDGLVLDNEGKLYTGKAKEILKTSLLKNEGYLLGQVNKGSINGFWEYHDDGKIQGYHCYRANGDTTYSFKKNGRLDWVEVYDRKENSKTEIKVDKKGNVEAMHIFKYNEDDSYKNIFEYERFPGNYFDVTMTDYDYTSLTVVDFFQNEKQEEEIIMRDFDKHHELIKLITKDHQVKQILFLGDILEVPEDADYRLEKGFNASFTELKDHQNFKLSLLAGKEGVFDVVVKDGQIDMIDKRLNNESLMLIYSKKEGYVPREHEAITLLLKDIQTEIDTFLK